jgi:diguanylate cyclase (GGDEF)-like protein
VERVDDVRRVAAKIVSSIGEPFELEERRVSIGVSVGASVSPVDGETLEALLRFADAEMYRVKNDGRNGFRVSADRLECYPRLHAAG